jgi:dihydrofolate synthase/folylpolyglutamate synthase
MILSYDQILHKLLHINYFKGVKLGLKNAQDLDRLLNHPSQSFPSIHIAGTNGKGSVSTKIAAAHQAAGLKVGLFTSPHIACFRERICIDRQMIPEKSVETHLNTLFAICKQHEIQATFFELTTLLAFMYFAEEKVDLAVLEVGLGGRLDATNIAKTILSVITSISLEHTQILGNTIEEITIEKAGIIKPSVPVVIGPRVSKNIINSMANAKKCFCIQVEGEFENYHQENSAIAKQVCDLFKLSVNAIEHGLKALPPCRMEIFSKNDLANAGFTFPLPETVILDVAHNPDGLMQLLKAIRNQYKNIPLRFVIGLSSNKDIESCLYVTKNEVIGWHLVEANNGRALPKEILAQEMLKIGIAENQMVSESSIESAVKNAIKIAGKQNEIIVICGTFFIMAEARKALGIYEPQDPQDVNERNVVHTSRV